MEEDGDDSGSVGFGMVVLTGWLEILNDLLVDLLLGSAGWLVGYEGRV